jgi:hypothetical protein
VGITLGIKDAFGAAGLIFAAVAGGSLLRRERQVPLKRRIRVAVVDRTANPAELEVSTLRPRRLSLPRMSITRELRDRLSRPLSILFARSAIDIRLCFARGAIFVHRKQQRSGHIHTLGSTVTARGTSGLRGIAMSEPIKSQSISRRRLFWLAVTAAALAAPATILSTSDVRAQQSDQAPAAEPTAPKTGEKKKKKAKTKKKATPGATTAPSSSPPTPPKQQ